MSGIPNRRIETTRKVVFEKDFTKGKSKKVIYKKGETHYIHKDVVEKSKLKDFGKVSEVDFKAEVAKAKKALGVKD